MNVRPVATVLGISVLVGAGLVLVGVLSADLNEAVLLSVGVVLTVLALRVPLLRRRERSIADVPDPGRRPSVPVPGATLSAAVSQFRTETAGFRAERDRTLADLRGAAVAVLSRFGGRTESEAIEAIDSGTWTDDERAGTLLSTGSPGTSSVRQRIASKAGGADPFRTAAYRAAAEIVSIAGTAEEHGTQQGVDSAAGSEGDSDAFESQGPVTPAVHRTTTESVDGIVTDGTHHTDHWTGISFVALVAVGAGVAVGSPAAVLAGGIGIGYAGITRAFQAPTPSVTVERTVSDTGPEPGETVDVRLTIENDTGRLLPDLRIVDGVPPGLAVGDGQPRLGTALRPGERATVEYSLTARRGRHEFDPVKLLSRDPTNAVEREFLAGCQTAVECEPDSRSLSAPVPLRPTAAGFAGRLTTAEGGPGIEFHSLREYRQGDPLSRVDWNTHARTGELATMRFHEERAARVLLLIDARQEAYRAPGADEPHAVDRAADAAGAVAASLLERGDTVGVAAVGPTSRPGREESAEPCWLAPASGASHQVRLQRRLASHPQLSTIPPDETTVWSGQLRLLRRRLRSETQVLVFTPLCDFGSMEIARRLDARGHPVTVVSPDPTTADTASQQLAGVARRIRALDLQGLGVPVVDWPHDEPIGTTFHRTSLGDRE